MIALIMAGGSGTRFWPASRASYPKQFLRIAGDKSMLQLTFERLEPLVPAENIHVVTSAFQAKLVREHLPQLPERNIIIEPFGMNTAPCIALSVAKLSREHDPDEAMVVLPADHVIQDIPAFLASLKKAEATAQTGALVTFGIVPEYPATGYGYIETGAEIDPGVLEVKRFKEKPALETATEFLRQGNFLWNSGMFCWTLGSIREAFAEYIPQALETAEKVCDLWERSAGEGEIAEAYGRMPRIPVDIGIMEPASRRAVIPVSYGWSDVGSWKALAYISPADEELNTFKKAGLALSSRDNYVYSDKFVALIGVDDLCVVETDDAILVTTKEQSEEVKKVVEHLKNNNKEELL
jgi:mannose-1-phosphate guanylyltransferase